MENSAAEARDVRESKTMYSYSLVARNKVQNLPFIFLRSVSPAILLFFLIELKLIIAILIKKGNISEGHGEIK